MFTRALTRLNKGIDRYAGRGAGEKIFSGVEGALAGEAFGYIHGRYREKAAVKILGRTIPINLLAGIAGKAAAVAGAAMSRGEPAWIHHVNAIGDAGLTTYFFADGVARGTKKAGRKIYLLDQGAAAPANLGGLRQTDVVGEIPPAVGGAFLDLEELQQLARKR